MSKTRRKRHAPSPPTTKDTGEYLGSVTLPAVPYGNPITYLHEGRQYIAVAVGTSAGAATAELIALALP